MVLLLSWPVFSANPPARFLRHHIASGLSGGYQVGACDLNGDGKPDLIALASGISELVWFENPSWRRHVIAQNFKQPINFAAWDDDSDGIPLLALASGFSMNIRRSSGEVHLLRHQGDPREPWSVTRIDRLPTSHRLRWADIDGKGRKVLVNAPLTAGEAPDYPGLTPLVYYRPGDWKRRVIEPTNQGVVHGLETVDWDGDRREELLTASFEGIHLFRHGTDGGWTRTELARGAPSPRPRSGSSDVAVGRVGNRRIMAAIEPWHGNQVVVYAERGGRWERRVIDDSLVEGHTVSMADLNGDGADEIVAGFRGKGHAVYVYYAEDASGMRWRRTLLDDSVAAASCVVADLNGDGRPDIACIGSATADLVWYENAGISPAP